jgi:hypothetical protein
MIGPAARLRLRPREGTERSLQARCEALLRQLQALGKISCWYHRPDRECARGEQRGLPDLVIGVRQGLVLAVELKSWSGKLRPEQEVWLSCWGAEGCVVRSTGELLDVLKTYGAA